MRFALVAFCLLASVPASAQRDLQRPVSELPARVAAAAGQLTLYADYAGAAGEQVPVYLVNRTGAAIVLDTQDGDPYLVRDVRIDGAWVRAEPFAYSFCGLSYYQVRIAPEHFLLVAGRASREGEPAPVRFRLAQHGAVSNVGAGRFSREQVLAAAHDVMAMRSAGARAIEDALVRTPPFPAHERVAAFHRLRGLPAQEAMPIALRVLGDAASSDSDLREALDVAHAVDPAGLARHVLALLDRPPSPLRTRTLARLQYVSVDDDAVVRRILAIGSQPGAPELRYLIPIVARTRRPDVRASLLAITRDARYDAQARLSARYHLEEWYGVDAVDVIAQPVGDWSDGHRLPVRMTVRLTNTSGHALDFRYAQLTDFLSLYVTRDRGDGLEFIEPRAGVRWFTSPRGATTAVHLAPGATQTFELELLDYFALAPGSAVTVWVSARIPGVHDEIAQLGGSGSGVNVQR